MSKEMVNHPAHYNNHPSGIEAIEVIESMCFNLGNAFKYVYRRNDKENFTQDIKKAIWYLEAEIKRREAWNYTFMAPLFYPLHMLSRQDIYTAYSIRGLMIDHIVTCEENADASEFYALVHKADKHYWSIAPIHQAKAHLQTFF